MTWELLRTFILITGWPILIVGSVIVMRHAFAFWQDLKKTVFGRLMLLMSLGWFVSMYSLGAVATVFMLDNPDLGVPVVLPIFMIWFGTMILISNIVWRLRQEAVTLIDLYFKQEGLVKERTKQLSEERDKLAAAKVQIENKVQELEKMNKLMVSRVLEMAKLRKKLSNRKKLKKKPQD